MFGLKFAFIGGLNAIIWNDLVQVVLYVGAALTVLIFLKPRIQASGPEIWQALAQTPEGVDKLRLFDFSLDWGAPFSVAAIVTGYALLNSSSTQRTSGWTRTPRRACWPAARRGTATVRCSPQSW